MWKTLEIHIHKVFLRSRFTRKYITIDKAKTPVNNQNSKSDKYPVGFLLKTTRISTALIAAATRDNRARTWYLIMWNV